VRVHLEGCELALGVLQDLRPGDLLRVRHRVDAPASVHAPQGALLFRGFLAARGGSKAVELAPVGEKGNP
jgi:hypothetical protein